MSTYLITCTPAHGHIAPLLTIARHLRGRGHRVRMLTSDRYAARVRAADVEFLPLPAAADVDLDEPDAAFPERRGLRGPAALRFDMINLFLAPGEAQLDAVRAALREAPADAVLTEPLFVGAALLNELPRTERPPVVALGIFPLGVKSRDTAPFGLGVPPGRGALARWRNAALTLFAEKAVFGAVAREADELARRTVDGPFSRFFLDWHSAADAVVQFTVPAFEYPRSDLPANVHFVGALPPTAPAVDLPEWWGDLDGSRPVVHVTQGTIANADFSQLIGPTLEALAGDDVLVVASLGGRVGGAVGPVPANARTAAYLPYDRLLPLTGVVVTNGGYGGVQQALAQGIPLVVAGKTEDKVEVAARVGWSGAGFDLRTNTPSAARVGAAVRRVLSDDRYRRRARDLAGAYAQASALDGLDRVLETTQSAAETRSSSIR